MTFNPEKYYSEHKEIAIGIDRNWIRYDRTNAKINRLSAYSPIARRLAERTPKEAPYFYQMKERSLIVDNELEHAINDINRTITALDLGSIEYDRNIAEARHNYYRFQEEYVEDALRLAKAAGYTIQLATV